MVDIGYKSEGQIRISEFLDLDGNIKRTGYGQSITFQAPALSSDGLFFAYGTLDEELNAEDRARLLSLLQTFGPLGAEQVGCDKPEDYTYQGSTRTGCEADPDNRRTPKGF